MPDDEETRVRQRLSRLFEPAAPGAGPPPQPGPPTATASRPQPDPPVDPHRPRSAPVRPIRSDLPSGSVTAERRDRWPYSDPDDEGLPRSAAIEDDEPPPTRSRLPGPGAFDPGRRGVRALAVVAVVVVLGAGLWAWRSRPHAEPIRPLSTVAVPEPSPAVPAANGQLVVAVAGKVRRPGLVRVPAGSRVADAVEAAGGALPGVDVALLNPARKVTDGELILVGVTAPPGAVGQPAGAAGPAPGGAAPGGAAPGGPVNLNTATLAQLDALPGVGPVLAQRILTHREQHGPFRSVSDLRQVEGIGDARYEQLKDLVTV